MRTLFRFFHVCIASVVAWFSFNGIYGEYKDGLPQLDANSIGLQLGKTYIDNVNKKLELWNHAFEHSIMYTFVIFFLVLVVLEYINLHSLFAKNK